MTWGMTHFETETCSRCNGSGSYSFCADYGDKCFKCRGSKVTLTKRGAAAKAYLESLCTVPAKELLIGDRVTAHGLTNGGKSYTHIATVVGIESRELQRVTTRALRSIPDGQVLDVSIGYTFNGEFRSSGSSSMRVTSPAEALNLGTIEETVTETTVSLSGKYGNSNIVGVDMTFRVYRDDNAAKIQQALEYQATLTKTGAVRKGKAK